MAGMCLQLSLSLLHVTYYDSLGHDINYLALSGILAVSCVYYAWAMSKADLISSSYFLALPASQLFL